VASATFTSLRAGFFYLLRLCKISVQHLAHTHLVGVSLMPPSGSLSRLQSSQWVIACLP
jgi:hypothetical protein